MRKKPLCAHVTRGIIPQHLQPHRCFLLLLLIIIIPVREEPGRAPHSLFLQPAAARLSSAPRGTDERCGIAPHDRDMLGFALVAGSVWFVLGEWESSERGGGALCYLVCLGSVFLLELLMLLFLRYAARDAAELEHLYVSACMTTRDAHNRVYVGALYGTGC